MKPPFAHAGAGAASRDPQTHGSKGLDQGREPLSEGSASVDMRGPGHRRACMTLMIQKSVDHEGV
jgi:hypothetical protein